MSPNMDVNLCKFENLSINLQVIDFPYSSRKEPFALEDVHRPPIILVVTFVLGPVAIKTVAFFF